MLWEREGLLPHDVLIGHVWRGGVLAPDFPVASILSSGWIWGLRRASATGGPRTLTGSSHSWKGVGHSWQGVWLRREGGVWLRLSGLAKQIWGFRRASATGGPRTLTGSSHSWKGVGHSWQGGLAPDCPARRSMLPDSQNAPTGGGDARTGRSTSERALLSRGEAAFARNASARLEECPPDHRARRNPENRDFEALFWGPPHDEPFRATRQHSTTRGEAPFQRGGLAPT